MAIKYKRPNIYPETWKNFYIKKHKMDIALKDLGINKTIPLTKVIYAISKKSIFLENRELIKLANEKKKGRCR